jgi:hypothetical protein
MKVSELKGPQLDYFVARAEGKKAYLSDSGLLIVTDEEGEVRIDFEPSTDWAQGGPIIERERICMTTCIVPGRMGCPRCGCKTYYRLDQ